MSYQNGSQNYQCENSSQTIQEFNHQLFIENKSLLNQLRLVEKENQTLNKEIEEKNLIIQNLQTENNDLASEKEAYLIQLKEFENNKNYNDFSFIRDPKYQGKQIEEMKKFEKKKINKQNSSNNQQNKNQFQDDTNKNNVLNSQQKNYNLRQKQFNNNNNNNSRQNNNNNLANRNLNVDNMSYEQLLELENEIGKVNTGFSRQQIQALNIVDFDSSKMQNVDKSCSICQNDYVNRDKLRLLYPCLHRMHQECVDEWLLLTTCQKEYNPQIHRILLEGGLKQYYFYVNIYVGSPPQRESLIVDTGSSKTIFPCVDCKDDKCGSTHLNKYFDYKSSSTFQPLKCQDKFENYQCSCSNQDLNLCTFEQNYSEGSSYQGYYMIDQAIFGDELYKAYTNKTLLETLIQEKYFDIQTQFMFGCATTETKLFRSQQVDGILGLGPDTNQQNTQPNLIDMAFKTHNHTSEKLEFSLCLGIDSGYLQIGGYNSQDHLLQGNNIKIKYDTSLVSDQYGVKLHKLKIGNQTLDEYFPTFFDSGTTYTYFPNKQYNFIMNQIDEHCKDPQNCLGEFVNNERCYLYKKNNITIQQFFDSFPIIYLQFDDDQIFYWPPMSYMYEKKKYKFCITIDSYGYSILGQNFMRYNDILFDRESKQITIRNANCSQYVYGDKEVYQNSIVDAITRFNENIQQIDYTFISIIAILGVAVFAIIIFFVLKKCKKHNELPSDEKIMIKKEDENKEIQKGNNDIEQQKGNKFQIADNEEQNIEMAYKDIYQEKLDEDDNSKVKQQLADFQKFNFETN
ncbi:hypothetical protein ABPG72_002581 [Tetrahymena utriculariae]